LNSLSLKTTIADTGAKTHFFIFFASVAVSLVALWLERRVGIAWNYHPDATTYATKAFEQYYAIKDAGLWRVFNNGHFLLSALFSQNVVTLTAINIALFALTNNILFHNQKRFFANTNLKSWIVLAMLLLSPYRIHLSTTILKDTIIIFLLVVVLCSKFAKYPAFALLLIWRTPAILYLALKKPAAVKLKSFIKPLLWAAPIVIVLTIIFWQPLFAYLNATNSTMMAFREFDSVPSFANLGIAGMGVRALLWPIFAIFGIFFVISPALAYFPLFLGAASMVIYNFFVHRSTSVHWVSFIPLAIIAAAAPGFTTYFRYAFPILVCLPIYLGNQKKQSNK
jgi:hypothetical protein